MVVNLSKRFRANQNLPRVNLSKMVFLEKRYSAKKWKELSLFGKKIQCKNGRKRKDKEKK
ncbi:MAG TPA: hypothetical protein VJ912_02855 [Candidatus Nanoarchaeia archaeon]|nr:hypothetical protein [Candidatus Nanoarchaeia archaeon]